MLRLVLVFALVESILFSTPKVSVYREKKKGKSEMSQGLWGAVKKMAINTASSAAGTCAVLGVHSAFGPDGEPKVSDSQCYKPAFK